MKNITFFDPAKCKANQKINKTKEHNTETQNQESKEKNLKQNRELKLNFSFIEIDKVFAN